MQVDRSVSSYTITPDMYCESPGVEKSICLYRIRLSSVFSNLMLSKRFAMVAMLSSAARIPFPWEASLFCGRTFVQGAL